MFQILCHHASTTCPQCPHLPACCANPVPLLAYGIWSTSPSGLHTASRTLAAYPTPCCWTTNPHGKSLCRVFCKPCLQHRLHSLLLFCIVPWTGGHHVHNLRHYRSQVVEAPTHRGNTWWRWAKTAREEADCTDVGSDCDFIFCVMVPIFHMSFLYIILSTWAEVPCPYGNFTADRL